MAAEPAQLLVADDELWRVQDWRLGELLRAGYDLSSATALAMRVDVDLHQACDLISRGCTAKIAAQILL